jgi:hypothetical protein
MLASLVPVSMKDCSTSWPDVLRSIAINRIGEPQAVHCKPWFCVSEHNAPSVRRHQLHGKASSGSRFHEVAHYAPLLYGSAVGAIEQPTLKFDRTGLMLTNPIQDVHGGKRARSQKRAERAARCPILTAGVINSMCVQPELVLEKRSKQQRYMPMLVSFGARRERAGMTHKVAPVLREFGLAVEPLFWRQFASSGRHDSLQCSVTR